MPSLDEWLRRISGNSWHVIEMGLDRVIKVYRNMGSPKPAEHSVVIAGTNGKGSTQAALRAGLEAAGLRTGTFSSPHLLRFNERIRIAGRLASDADLCASFERIVEHQDGVRLTYFEYATLAALDLMSRADLDVALLEIGMGGRLDAVNIIDADISVITSISLDHTHWLGDTREAIAVEKAGIMRPGRPVICAEVDAPAMLCSEAGRIGAQVERNGVDFAFIPDAAGTLTWRGGAALNTPKLHPEACAAALRTLERLEVPLSHEVLHAVSDASLPGRCEQRSWCGRTVVMDVAHNPASVERLADWLSVQRPDPADGSRCWGVFACLDDKPIEAMLAPFAGLLDGAAAVQLSGERSLGLEQLIGRMRTAGIGVIASGDCSAALAGVLQHSQPGDWIIVFGSFLTVAGVMQHLQLQTDVERVAK